ncbi:MAG: DUF3857 domain-containing protein [Cytophagales bacterium]|nr:MAG: DUF3857 domain-containing protein [Cytophagales bacterium]
MNCKLATLFFLIFIVKSYSQNDLTVTQIPNWVNFQNVPENDNYDSGDIKYLLLDEQINIDKEVSYNHISIRVNTQNGIQTIFPYKLEYDPSYQKLKFHTLTIIRAKEKINKLQKKSITILNREHNAEKHLLTKSLTALINLDDIIIGDIIDLEYSIEGFNPIFKGHFSNSFPISAQIYLQKVHINVLCNPNKKIYYKYIGLNKKEPFITTKNNLKSYEWSFKTINPIPNEEGVPFWYLQSTYLDISDCSSWSDVVKWGISLLQKKKYNTIKYRALYDSIKANSIGKYSYVINSLRYVQDEIRYLSVSNGINSYKPHSPDVVLENRYGDCKDKVYLLLSLLEKEGIESYPVLVNSELSV